MSRFSVFLLTVLAIWAAMHSYVFWRLSGVPWISRHISCWWLAAIGLAGWLSYPLSRMLESRTPEALALPLEYLAATWLGVLFLLLSALLITDVITLGGWLWASRAGAFRGWAACAALLLSTIALIQGHREPVVTNYEVTLKNLPREMDGMTAVAFSDIHLGILIRQRWLERMVARVNALKPHLILAVGDVVDGNADRVTTMVPVLSKLKAPLGVWAVTGNHDYYAGVNDSVRIFEDAGMRVLRDTALEVAPGLVLAGVDDLTARGQFGQNGHPIEKALTERPPGATIYLSHTPLGEDLAAQAGAGLMLCGHTHNGQIWPFTYIVRMRYPRSIGRHQVGDMTMIIGRGTGTWGPRMRLWHRGEILRIVLRSDSES